MPAHDLYEVQIQAFNTC